MKTWRIPVTTYYQLAIEEAVVVTADSLEGALKEAEKAVDRLPRPEELPAGAQFVESLPHPEEAEPLEELRTSSFDELPKSVVGSSVQTVHFFVGKWTALLSQPGGLPWALSQMECGGDGVYRFQDGPLQNVAIELDLEGRVLAVSVRGYRTAVPLASPDLEGATR
ncbi:hypothetical protein Ocepr_2275 (plasmid) [Oceanithermus profundus DSM 14977]|uniref:Uncharacterized protein n=1 Tax=Oceanithermus profundus (strain DSM 14977 / NBRC 100410 / VKM B-2274 / 506) TaxID=670487 RepID=E4UAT8_OCEP5|nr:hypothetical protein [Oceanithermus profundus]ADR37723.1 hypothetical protein Ocepr_2275 [Oceanithermus profundus DSM 14977]